MIPTALIAIMTIVLLGVQAVIALVLIPQILEATPKRAFEIANKLQYVAYVALCVVTISMLMLSKPGYGTFEMIVVFVCCMVCVAAGLARGKSL